MAAIPDLPEIASLERSWRRWATLLILGFFAIAIALALIVLPTREPGGGDFFTALCRALGISGYEAIPTLPPAATAAPASDVVWTGDLRRILASASKQRGAAIAADNCATCHGDDGLSTDKDQIPNLAAQSDEAIFKELRDYATGARVWDLMAAPAQSLNPQQMADVAAFYAALPPARVAPAADGVSIEILRLVHEGDPSRGIPGCDSCHGMSKSGPEGAPFLVGHPASYLDAQLQNFATAARHNDLFERMRTIARELTRDETHQLAIYYGGNPLPVYK